MFLIFGDAKCPLLELKNLTPLEKQPPKKIDLKKNIDRYLWQLCTDFYESFRNLSTNYGYQF